MRCARSSWHLVRSAQARIERSNVSVEQPLVQHAKSFHRVPVRHGGSGWRSVLGMPCSEPLERPRARRMALGRRAGAGCLQGDLTEQLEAQAGAVAATREALGAMSRIEPIAASWSRHQGSYTPRRTPLLPLHGHAAKHEGPTKVTGCPSPRAVGSMGGCRMFPRQEWTWAGRLWSREAPSIDRV